MTNENTEIIEKTDQDKRKLADIARDQIFAGVPEVQQAIAITMANRYGLDPVLKHVQPLKFGQKWQSYITKAGLLHVAHQSGQLAGFSFQVERSENPITGKPDVSCTCTVHRKDMEHPISSTVWLSEYRSGNPGPWQSHTNEMLKKVALVSAFRMAFDVSIPAIEEMDRVHEIENLPAIRPKPAIGEKFPETIEWVQGLDCDKISLTEFAVDYCKDNGILRNKRDNVWSYIPLEVAQDFYFTLTGNASE